MNELSRRKFLSSAVKGSVGTVALAACDKRTPIGTDLRRPAAPTNLVKGEISEEQLELKWTPNPGLDYLGAKTELSLTYRVYCNNILISSEPILLPIYTHIGYSLYSRSIYEVTCIDEAGNESDRSVPMTYDPTQGKLLSVYQSDSILINNRTIDKTVVRTVLDAAIKDFTNINDLGKAYESFFHGITATKKIGIKINCLAGAALSTHPQLVDSIVEGLQTMLNGTYPADNITIFDDRNPQMTLAGFPERNTPGQSRILVAPWSTESLTILQTPQKLSSMITECDYLINVPVLKVHPYAGITFALKNYYGLIDNPSALHGNLCTPGIAEVYKYAHAKTKLIVGDAIFGSYVGDNTTPPNFIPKSIYIGSDPVAMDLYALYRINKERTLKNRALISVDGDGDARHISVAGSAPYNLGDLSFAPSSVEVKTL